MSFGGPFLLAPLTSMFGIRPGMNVSVINPPSDFMERFLPLPEGVTLLDTAVTGIDVAVVFSTRKTELIERMTAAVKQLAVTGALWVIFPVNGTGPMDLSEDFARLAALEIGLTDTKKLVFDADWTGLKLQYRAKPPRPEIPRAEA